MQRTRLTLPCILLASVLTLPTQGMAQALNSGGLASASTNSNQGLPKIVAPTRPRTLYTSFPWKYDIVATIFWVGEDATQNNPVPNDKSSWDVKWEENFGGYDDPDASNRNHHYCPADFVPQENPFYVALPYNDVAGYRSHKAEAPHVIPWFKQRFEGHGQTVLKDQWIAIRHGNRVCYAQWSDCGPFVTDDYRYVFGQARPKNTKNKGAGIDISPAVRDYLRLTSGAKVDWRFVSLNEIAHGPWCRYGRNNHFVQNQEQREVDSQKRMEELRRMRDEWFRNQRQPTSVGTAGNQSGTLVPRG